jgi:hypothetical protein
MEMYMDWALGISAGGNGQEVDLLSTNGQVTVQDVAALIKVGIPLPTKRVRISVEGDLSAWGTVSADDYLAAFGIVLSESAKNQHQVFFLRVKKVSVHVPALVLMRAFFKPVKQLLPRMFRPANIDEFSFVDYSSYPPVVVIDEAECRRQITMVKHGDRQDASINWLQTSKSARNSAQSVHANSISGKIGLSLPSGNARIVFHGLSQNGHLFATQAALVSIAVNKDDSITGTAEHFIFHSMADAERKPSASVLHLKVALRSDGESCVTDQEWSTIEPMLAAKFSKGKCVHPQRELLDSILFKLAHNRPWKKVSCTSGTTADLVSAFRRWVTSNRLQPALEYLSAVRVL